MLSFGHSFPENRIASDSIEDDIVQGQPNLPGGGGGKLVRSK